MIDLSSKSLTGTLSEDLDLVQIPFLQALWLYDNPALTGVLLVGDWLLSVCAKTAAFCSGQVS